ncbi:MAG: decarboxylating 6-phosphogluconate dehydrogenase [Firmicutes bacterium]|nr:decarboxylating 6-phosphogluconate dehydrogenase [Bacillota bacterium]
MQIAMIGLGKMGANMCRRLASDGHDVIGFDINESSRKSLSEYSIKTAATMEEMVSDLQSPRVVWVMVPAGAPTDATITQLSNLLEAGDIVIDGGNSNYKTAFTYSDQLAKKQIGFIDAGTSGGVWGLQNGYCLMVGGNEETVKVAEPIFLTLAPEGGYAHVGPVGAGHFVKMVHNGIEYGLMQAYAEGFELMDAAKEFNLDLHQIASIWRYGSVVRSWLLELAEIALREESGFQEIEGYVVDSGEGRWTVEEAIERGVPLEVISLSLYRRFATQHNAQNAFSNKILAALRNQFGGHSVELLKDNRDQ